MLEILFIFVIASIFVFMLIFAIRFFVCYSMQQDGRDVIELSFKEFYSYYKLNPESWRIDECMLSKVKENEYGYYKCRIKFSSYLRFLIFCFEYECDRAKKLNKDEYVKFLKEVQTDIDNCKKEAKFYVDKGYSILDELTK